MNIMFYKIEYLESHCKNSVFMFNFNLSLISKKNLKHIIEFKGEKPCALPILKYKISNSNISSPTPNITSQF